MLRVARPHLNLRVKPRKKITVFWKKYNFMILKGKMPFKMHIIIFFSRKKNIKINMCLPYLKFSHPLPETDLYFYLALLDNDRDVGFSDKHSNFTICFNCCLHENMFCVAHWKCLQLSTHNVCFC